MTEPRSTDLASMHEVGELHRDVKPSNVLMEGRPPIVIDIGLARGSVVGPGTQRPEPGAGCPEAVS